MKSILNKVLNISKILVVILFIFIVISIISKIFINLFTSTSTAMNDYINGTMVLLEDGNNYAIYYDKYTKVMYVSFGKNNAKGGSVLYNADGSLRLYEEYLEEKK